MVFHYDVNEIERIKYPLEIWFIEAPFVVASVTEVLLFQNMAHFVHPYLAVFFNNKYLKPIVRIPWCVL